MKPDSMFVERENIDHARRTVTKKGSREFLNELGQSEPALASYIYKHLTLVAGKLALSGVATEIVQGSHEEVLDVLLTCVQAMLHEHETRAGTSRPHVDPSVRPNGHSPESRKPTSDTEQQAERRIGFAIPENQNR